MKRTIIVAGHGPGISEAVARRFGREGFAVALVARNGARINAAAAALAKDGIEAKAFPCDLGEPDAVRALVRDVKASLGPIAVLHYNAYKPGAGDLLTTSTAELRDVLDVTVHGLVAAVQEALPDLKEAKGAVLVTGGGLAFYDPKVEAMAVEWKAMGLSIGKAAQHKLTGLLHQRLAREGVYAADVVVTGLVKGTAFDSGNATIEPSAVAEKFWELFQKRDAATVTFS